jgi:hypothetical protein
VDNHVIRILCEYRDEGGRIDWIAQTPPELASIERSVSRALGTGANAISVQGGQGVEADGRRCLRRRMHHRREYTSASPVG